jgi:hypothetical protein
MTDKLSLIAGEFSQEEAREILMNVFSTKINFHQRKNFSSWERFGEDDPTAVKRLPALQEEVAHLEQLLSAAKNSGARLRIHADITLEFLAPDAINTANEEAKTSANNSLNATV